jgi:outer membrane protein TolC
MMAPDSMRLARLASVLFALIIAASSGSSSPARADVVGRVLASAYHQPGGPSPKSGAQAAQPGPTAPPAQSADLSQWAGEPRATTLPELLQIAVRDSPSLQSAKIDIAVAEARIQQTWARNDWLLGAKLDGSRFSSTTSKDVRVDGTADLSRALPTGGTVDLHAGTGYEYARNPGSVFAFTLNDQPFTITTATSRATTWTTDVSGSISQPLLRNRGRELFDANEVRATLARDAAVLARRLAAIQTVSAVISAYWDLVLAEQTVAITQGSLDLARERLRVTQIGADGGKVPRSEIPAVLQIIATREEDVLNGELGVLNASIVLRRSAGMPIGAGELGLRVSTDLATQDQAIELGPLVERALAASPELAQLAKQDQSATIDIAVAENGLLPQLDAALKVGPTGIAGSFGDAASNLAKFDAIAIEGSLTFSQSLGRHDALGRTREQRELRQKLAVNAVDVRAQVAQTMSRAVAQLELARRRVTLSQRAIDLANENIKIETDRFNLGKATNFDVLNRLEELRQAELRKAQALIDWHKAEVVIQSLTGDLLPTYGLTVD